jgi:hypothetical protein
MHAPLVFSPQNVKFVPEVLRSHTHELSLFSLILLPCIGWDSSHLAKPVSCKL